MFRVITCLSGAHDLRLVALAGFVCFFASFVGVNLLGRARATQGHTRLAWLALAGIATGCGIWATHFIAMLAYEPGVPIAFDIGITGLSLIFAATITGAAFSIAVNHPSLRGSALAGVVGSMDQSARVVLLGEVGAKLASAIDDQGLRSVIETNIVTAHT